MQKRIQYRIPIRNSLHHRLYLRPGSVVALQFFALGPEEEQGFEVGEVFQHRIAVVDEYRYVMLQTDAPFFAAFAAKEHVFRRYTGNFMKALVLQPLHGTQGGGFAALGNEVQVFGPVRQGQAGNAFESAGHCGRFEVIFTEERTVFVRIARNNDAADVNSDFHSEMILEKQDRWGQPCFRSWV